MKKLLLSIALCGALYGSDESERASINNFDELNCTVSHIVTNSFPDASKELLISKVNLLGYNILQRTQFFNLAFATENLFASRNNSKLVIYILDGHFDRIKCESLSDTSQNADTVETNFDGYLNYINSLSEHAKNNLKLLPQMGKIWTKDEWDAKIASAPHVTLTSITQEEAEDTFSKEQLDVLEKSFLISTIAFDIIHRSFPNRNILVTSNEEIREEQKFLECKIMLCSQGIKQLIEAKSPDFNDTEYRFNVKISCELMIYILDAHIERMEHVQEKTSRLEEQSEYAKEVVSQIRENLNALNDLK